MPGPKDKMVMDSRYVPKLTEKILPQPSGYITSPQTAKAILNGFYGLLACSQKHLYYLYLLGLQSNMECDSHLPKLEQNCIESACRSQRLTSVTRGEKHVGVIGPDLRGLKAGAIA